MYCTVQEIRDEGVAPEQATDARITMAIKLAGALIDKITGQWFEPRELTLVRDGRGGCILHLPVPVISVLELKVDGEVLDPKDYVVYSSPEDRRNPKIYCSRSFPRGRRNVEIAGVFGYVDQETDEAGQVAAFVTPEPIRHACRRLVIRELGLLGDPEAQDERRRARVASETTDGRSYSLALEQRFSGFTGDPDVDGILVGFVRPPAIGGA